jgi:putative transposase
LLERSSPSSLSDAGRSTPRESPLDKQKGVQGSTFTAEAFTSKLVTAGVVISMDGRGRFMDNIFIERLWRSIKYEEVHLKAYADGCEARSGISSWMNFYNFRRPHQAMNNQMPMAVWRAGMDKIEAAARAVDMPLRWTTQKRCPHAHSRSSKKRLDT